MDARVFGERAESNAFGEGPQLWLYAFSFGINARCLSPRLVSLLVLQQASPTFSRAIGPPGRAWSSLYRGIAQGSLNSEDIA